MSHTVKIETFHGLYTDTFLILARCTCGWNYASKTDDGDTETRAEKHRYTHENPEDG